MNNIYITDRDYLRLQSLVQLVHITRGPQIIKALSTVLKRAKVIASEQIQKDIITMNSRVRIKELKNSEEMEIKIVYPKDAHLPKGRISVLAPVGTAVLGCKVGDEIDWLLPQGTVTYKIEELIYQPEAGGDLDL
ncbi:nucleoside diphosphate kinase regulator [Adhaeribacter radiodurans]|uniref:Nucleoside diphosphate kinase regulator n=1 Tax=Adhaeribacter radiodurans TaxID=2745197 RepID=A0A7L7LA04_9BACT|nr:nucleoside diphosphate kinase regulator [Adhaeribacter radiodurans]QMU29676.1 nucleoside diphosphate kinase regulator [Adhaeribacter radiodurans]